MNKNNFAALQPTEQPAKTTATVQPEAAQDERKEWRCFHCNEHFIDEADARLHFGKSERQSPACSIDIAEYRAMESRMEAYNDEDADIHRRMARMQIDHAQALRREEEKGYARGLADAKRDAAQAPKERELHDRIATALDLSLGSVNGKRIVFGWNYMIGLIDELRKAADAEDAPQERAVVTDAAAFSALEINDLCLRAEKRMTGFSRLWQAVPLTVVADYTKQVIALLSLSAQSSEQKDRS